MSSDLVRQFAKKYGWEEKMEVFKIRDFLEHYLDESLCREITNIDLTEKVLTLTIQSPLLRHDFRMRSSFYLEKFRKEAGEEKISQLRII